MKVYFLSGLGADRRVFEGIRLPAGCEMVHLDWIKHQGDEPLESYVRRMAERIDDKEPFCLVGVSFGGIVANEMSKFLKPERLVLISTVASYRSLPFLYRLAGNLKLYKLLPEKKVPAIKPFLYWFFGPIDKRGKHLIDSFFEQTDTSYIKWALGRISMWRSSESKVPYVHIHGKNDRAFPLRLTKADYILEGGHSCVFSNAERINSILEKVLK